MTAKFDRVAPEYMHRLLNEPDFGFSVEDAAAIFGNAGHESAGLETLQEIKPTVKGSLGGYGWFQWTGPRRRAFAAWCVANKMRPDADEANYRFLCHELRTGEAGAVRKVKAAMGLAKKVVAFEASYERAGVKHYDKRLVYAKRALSAYQATYGMGKSSLAVMGLGTLLPPEDDIQSLLYADDNLSPPAGHNGGPAMEPADWTAPINKALAAGKGAAESVAATATTVTGTAAAISGYTSIFNGVSPTVLLVGFGGVLLLVTIVIGAWWTARRTFNAPANAPVISRPDA